MKDYIKKYISNIPLWAIVVTALVIRLAFNINVFFDESLAMQSDSGSYLQPAREILGSGGYGSVLRTPGYPLFIALIWLITPGASIAAVIVSQIIIDSMVPLLIVRMKGFWQPEDALNRMGAVLYALNPLAIYYSGKIMSEALFVFWLVLSFYFFKQFLNANKTNRWQAVFGTTLAAILTILTRPVGLWFCLLYFVMMMFIHRNLKLQFSLIITVVILTAMIWSWRNYEKSGIFTLSTMSNYNLFVFGQIAYAVDKNLSQREAQKVFQPALETAAQGTNLSWREIPESGQLGKKLILESFGAAIKTSVIGWIKCAFQPGWGVNQINQMIFSGKYEIEEGGDKTNLSTGSALQFPFFQRLWKLPVLGILLWIYGALYLIFLYKTGIDKFRSIKHMSTRLIFGICILFFIIIAGPLGFSRFRFPAEVILLI
ncbi:MAG: hypothetical protein JXR46_00405 [Calditrichaceae bacterium]|nr:hypothetical protein [Calditrichaceae bacterium]MBN2707474.1 hypothetical protein [Calditrichaceae bacterium]RQV95565.1 MAG: hypothetical protein EH224_06805 [Calditrichota bacterium]